MACQFCGKEFAYFPSVRKDARFCSRSCLAKSRTGPNASNWRGGAAEYYGPNWVIQRKHIRHRDNYTCQGCGITEADLGRELDVHHKKPYDVCANYQEANESNNLISLCHTCHKNAEREAIKIWGKPSPKTPKYEIKHPYITPAEAGKIVGVTTWMIYKHIEKGRIKAIDLANGLPNRVRPRFAIEISEIERFLSSKH